jgi:hypothetical protein
LTVLQSAWEVGKCFHAIIFNLIVTVGCIYIHSMNY